MKRKLPELEALDGRKSKIHKLSFETVEIKQEKSSDEESSSDDDDDDSSSDDENEVKIELDEPQELLNLKILHNDEKRRFNIITTPFLTKFEIAKVIGIRAQHIAMGSPVAVETHGQTNPIEIAKIELKAQKIDMVIKRLMPNGTYEQHHVRDLILPETHFYIK